MITHVIVELEHPIEECWMRDYSDEYYGIGTPLVRCKECKHWNFNNDTHRCFVWCVYTRGDGYCHRAERKEE